MAAPEAAGDELSLEAPEEFDDLPEFANDENRELHRKLKDNEKNVSLMEAELTETRDRIETMKGHLTSVNAEQLHTQRLVDAKIKEIETEDHLKQLAERERGRYHGEYKKLAAELIDLQDKINGVQAAVFKGNEKMDQFKLQMNWNQEELEQWALAARQKEEDNLALLKYTKADESKMKDLNLQLEKMLSAVQQKRTELESEVTETQAAQIELDKTADDFRSLHHERQDLVGQWEAAVQAMQKRDESIQHAREQFLAAKRQLREKQELFEEREAFLQTEQKNNMEVIRAQPPDLRAEPRLSYPPLASAQPTNARTHAHPRAPTRTHVHPHAPTRTHAHPRAPTPTHRRSS